MKHIQFGNNTSKSSTKMKSSYNSRNKSFTYNLKNTNSLLSPIRTTSKKVYNLNPKNFQPKKNLTSFNDSTYDTHNKIKPNKSNFSYGTNITNYKSSQKLTNVPQSISLKRPLSSTHSNVLKNKWRFSDEPIWKKFLRGKLLYLLKKNIILCESKFNPLSFTESISNVHLKEFKNKFRNMDNRTKVGIFTNKFPQILDQGNKFYSRYFDHFISPDELLYKNFTKEEIFQIKADPIYFNLGGNFNNVYFFKRKSLKEILNEEEKIGPEKLVDVALKKSLKQTKKRINKYMDYYSSVMSRQGMIS